MFYTSKIATLLIDQSNLLSFFKTKLFCMIFSNLSSPTIFWSQHSSSPAYNYFKQSALHAWNGFRGNQIQDEGARQLLVCWFSLRAPPSPGLVKDQTFPDFLAPFPYCHVLNYICDVGPGLTQDTGNHQSGSNWIPWKPRSLCSQYLLLNIHLRGKGLKKCIFLVLSWEMTL